MVTKITPKMEIPIGIYEEMGDNFSLFCGKVKNPWERTRKG